MAQFPPGITFKGGDVEVEGGEENMEELDARERNLEGVDVDAGGKEKVEEIDANVESEEEAEKADKADDNWKSRKTMSPRGTVRLETVH